MQGTTGTGDVVLNGPDAKTIFVSFAPEDREFGTDLVTILKRGLPHIAAYPSMSPTGRSWADIALRELAGELIVIPILSPGYIDLKLGQRELANATQWALEGKLRLIPVIRTACEPQGLVGMLEFADFTDKGDIKESLRQLINAISAERVQGAEPGLVRRDVGVRELTSNVFHLIEKEVLPTDRPILTFKHERDPAAQVPRTIFLSYASRDRAFVAFLTSVFVQRLPEVKLRDRLLEPPTPPFWETVARRMGERDVFLAILSPEYLANHAILEELAEATRLALCGQGRLVPVMRRPCNPPGFIGILEPADFTSAARDSSSVDDLIAGILGSRAERIEAGEARSGLTIGEIGRATDEVNRTSRRKNMEEKLYLKNLRPEERSTIQRDIVKEIDATVSDIHVGTYDQELKEGGLEYAKELLPPDLPWTIPSGQQLSGLEIALITLVAKEGIKVTDRVLTDLWTKIVFPRIKQRWGARVSRSSS